MKNLAATLSLLEQDFLTLVEKLPEKYSPYGIEPMSHIGCTYFALKCMIGDNQDIIMQKIGREHDNPLYCIEEELESAQRYHDKWEHTGDEHYKNMAQDELRHAEYLMKLHKMSATEPAEKSMLRNFSEEHQRLSSLLSD